MINTDKEIIDEIEGLKQKILSQDDPKLVISKIIKFVDYLSSEPNFKANFKVKYSDKVYDVVRVRELSNGHIMYGILNEHNIIDYVNKDSCELVASEDLVNTADNYAWSHSTIGCTIDGKQYRVPCADQMKIAVIFGANWEKERLINKACDWLRRCIDVNDEVVNEFKKAMEE